MWKRFNCYSCLRGISRVVTSRLEIWCYDLGFAHQIIVCQILSLGVFTSVPFTKTSKLRLKRTITNTAIIRCHKFKNKFTRVYLPCWRALARYLPCGGLLTSAFQNDQPQVNYHCFSYDSWSRGVRQNVWDSRQAFPFLPHPSLLSPPAFFCSSFLLHAFARLPRSRKGNA